MAAEYGHVRVKKNQAWETQTDLTNVRLWSIECVDVKLESREKLLGEKTVVLSGRIHLSCEH